MKDHEIAAIVNELRDIAVQYHGSGQLRERIAHVIVPVLKSLNPVRRPVGAGDGNTFIVDCIPHVNPRYAAPSTLAQQIASAQAETDAWPEGKLARVRAQGGDQP